jgi:hypothetical protein
MPTVKLTSDVAPVKHSNTAPSAKPAAAAANNLLDFDFNTPAAAPAPAQNSSWASFGLPAAAPVQSTF